MKNRRLIISFVVLFGFSMLASGQARKSNPPRETAPNPATTKSNLRPEKARDPVCGIMVEKDPQLAAEYKGKTYYFCSKADRDKFKQSPQKYVKDK
jgi:YHS domain-containing protein